MCCGKRLEVFGSSPQSILKKVQGSRQHKPSEPLDKTRSLNQNWSLNEEECTLFWEEVVVWELED